MPDPNGTNSSQNSALEIIMGVLGTTLATGPQKDYIEVPWNCTIFRWTLLGDETGSVQVDVWNCQESAFDGGATHPTVGDSIVAGNFPTISGSTKGQDTVLAGWTRTLVGGSIIGLNINSVASIQKLTLSLEVYR
jgi:hypothetical protein